MTILKSTHGSVKPYTRHIQSCRYRSEPAHNGCPCPKWLYARKRGEKPTRSTLSTSSWAEAQKIAADTLRAMDPEIAAVRAVTGNARRKLITVKDACSLWMQRVKRDQREQGTCAQYNTASRQLQRWTQDLGVEYVQEITSLMLEKWYSSPAWTGYAQTTRRQRWVLIRSMFRYWHEHRVITENPATAIRPIKKSADHVQGPYTDKQVQAILRQTESDPRLRAFVLLLLHSGCDVIDAVLFEPGRIKETKIEGRSIAVYNYKRRKTRVEAVVPIRTEVADCLMQVPLDGTRSSAIMSFRDPEIGLIRDRQLWTKRVMQAIRAAGVEWVELPTVDDHGRSRRKAANCKQFRHTAAVRWLSSGQRPEEVACMLGHVDTDMVRKHYAPWVPSLQEAHLRQIVRNWAD